MVLVCHPHKFVFLKTRKTAGTSVEMCLEPLCAPDGHVVVEKTHTLVSDRGVIGRRLIEKSEHTEDDRTWFNHMTARAVADLLGRMTFKDYRKIITVRNPFDRMVSAFVWSKSGSEIPADFAKVKKKFRNFVLKENAATDQRIVTFEGKHVADFTIRYENLQADLDRAVAALGLTEALPPLPSTKSMAKQRKKIPVAEYFDEEMIAAVRRQMAWVFEHYGYPDRPDETEPGPAADTMRNAPAAAPQYTPPPGIPG